MTLKELARLKEEMDAERRDKERAIGALEQLMKQLKKETRGVSGGIEDSRGLHDGF
jgi:hypothetical protein